MDLGEVFEGFARRKVAKNGVFAEKLRRWNPRWVWVLVLEVCLRGERER